VLVVDDDPEVRALLRDYLEYQGYEVEVATTAIGGLVAMRQRQPDVVLLDLMMPGSVQGEAVVRAISAEAPVIVISGNADAMVARRTLQEGAFDFVMKPFPLGRVSDLVEAALVHRAREAVS
jgi:two-component system nitrogen regulation response regulator NtrX